MKSLINYWRTNATARAGVRTVAVAVVSYFVAALAQGGAVADWHSFLWGAAGAAGYAVLGVLTPLEPKIGPVKADVT